MSDTGLKFPTATGDDHNQWSNPANAYANNGSAASESTVNQKQDWYNFSFGVPAGATIDGIEVKVEARDIYCDPNGADVELSWNGGASYTSSGKGFDGNCESWSVETLGGATDTWGRSWSDSDFSDANFRIRLSMTGYTGDGIDVDYIQVKVHYTPAPVQTKYSGLVTDTLNDAVAENKLTEEIDDSSIVPTVDHINVHGSDLDIYMSDALSGAEETTLDGVVAAHDGVADTYTSAGYGESDGESSTSSGSWQTKLSTDVDCDGITEYMMSWYGEIQSSNNTTNVKVRILLDDTTVVAETFSNPGENAYGSVSGFKKISPSSGTCNIKVQYCSDGGMTVKLRKARVDVRVF